MPPKTKAEDVAAVWVSRERLRPWPANPRKNDDAAPAVAQSLKRFGWGAVVLARESNGEIVAGHTRDKAVDLLRAEWGAATPAKHAEWSKPRDEWEPGKGEEPWHPEAIRSATTNEVPVRFGEWSEREAHLLALADNRLNEKAEWDAQALPEIMGDYSLPEVELAGWSGADLEELSIDLLGDDEPGETEEDEVPEPPKNPVTKPGDLWVMGDHRLLCGDCRDADAVAMLVNEQNVNVAFTSPPYASQRTYDESSGFKPIHPDEYVEWFEPVQANVRAHLAEDGSWFVNIKPHSEGLDTSLYVFDMVLAHARVWGWHFASEFCWERAGIPGKAHRRFKNQFEPVYQFALGEWRFRPKSVLKASSRVPSYSKDNHLANGLNDDTAGSSGDGFVDVRSGMAYPGNRLPSFSSNAESLGHSAVFPVGLPTFFVKAYSDPGDLIFDPFMGSGTTMIAAQKEGRRSVGTELSPAYCDVIVERWESLTGGKAERVKNAA